MSTHQHGHELTAPLGDQEAVLADLDWPTPDLPNQDAPAEQKPRVWVEGEVALEPRDTPNQGQQFANWARSRLTYYVGIEPPEGYTGVTYRQLKKLPDTKW